MAKVPWKNNDMIFVKKVTPIVELVHLDEVHASEAKEIIQSNQDIFGNLDV